MFKSLKCDKKKIMEPEPEAQESYEASWPCFIQYNTPQVLLDREKYTPLV